jgi:DNA mismatch repair ATPase MutS
MRSFGTYVGRLAGLDDRILRKADLQSEWMRSKVKQEWLRKHLDDQRESRSGRDLIQVLRQAKQLM